MTDTRMRGFKSHAELEEQLADISDETAEVHADGDQQGDLQDLEREAAWLRKEILDLRSQLHVALGGHQTDQVERPAGLSYWRWTVGFTIAAALLHCRTHLGERKPR